MINDPANQEQFIESNSIDAPHASDALSAGTRDDGRRALGEILGDASEFVSSVADYDSRARPDDQQGSRESRSGQLAIAWEESDFSPTAYLATDSWGIVQDANGAATTLLKVSKNQLVGVSLKEFFPRASRQSQWSNLLGALGISEEWKCRLELQASDGVQFPCAVNFSRYEKGGSPETSWLWEIRDLTRMVPVAKPKVPPKFSFERETAELFDIALEIGTKPNLSARLESIVDRVYAAMAANCLALYLYDSKLRHLELEVARGFPLTLNLQQQIGEGIIGKVAMDRSPMLIQESQIWIFRSPPVGNERFTGIAVPLISFEDLVGVMCVGVVGESTRKFGWSEVGLLTIFGSIAALVVTAARANAGVKSERSRRKRIEYRLKKALSQIQELAEKMETLRTEERERLSRDLHDDLGQLLTGFKLEVSQIAKSQQSLLEKLSRLATISDTTIEQVQRISSDLRQEALIELGLPRAIEKQAEDFQARSGIACRVMVDKSFRDLEQNLSTMLLRVLQEALSNVVRHSAASQVEIELKESKDCLRLQITDNGRGVDESVVDDPRSLGIQGMRERAKPFGGKVGIVNVKPSGTAVIVEVSLGKSSEKESL